jgi:hypothetical protein
MSPMCTTSSLVASVETPSAAAAAGRAMATQADLGAEASQGSGERPRQGPETYRQVCQEGRRDLWDSAPGRQRRSRAVLLWRRDTKSTPRAVQAEGLTHNPCAALLALRNTRAETGTASPVRTRAKARPGPCRQRGSHTTPARRCWRCETHGPRQGLRAPCGHAHAAAGSHEQCGRDR